MHVGDPRTLTDVNKMVRMQAASRLLQQFEDGDAFFKSLVTTDESHRKRIFHYCCILLLLWKHASLRSRYL
jgi:hypothetical protein